MKTYSKTLPRHTGTLTLPLLMGMSEWTERYEGLRAEQMAQGRKVYGPFQNAGGYQLSQSEVQVLVNS